jgi:hypothetical protein
MALRTNSLLGLLDPCSRGGMGGREAAVDGGGGGGAAAGHGGAHQDPLHFALPHRRLLLGSQGIYLLTHPNLISSIDMIQLLLVGFHCLRGRLRCSLGYWVMRLEGMYALFPP